MRIIYALTPFIFSLQTVFAETRSIFKDRFGNGVSNAQLRRGNIEFSQIPNILIAVTNNLLSFVGYISLGVILIGALMYVFSGVNEEWKGKGKEAIKMALMGAVVSWSAWIIVNLYLDNI